MNTWPDRNGDICGRFIRQLHVRNSITLKVYRCILRGFQRFVVTHSPSAPLSRKTIGDWLHERSTEWPSHLVIHRARLVDRFLDWAVANDFLPVNPFAELRATYDQRCTTPIVRALLSPDPTRALEALRPLPRFGSHLGPLMRRHLTFMRALGYRYEHEAQFLRFDRFLQSRPDLAGQPLAICVREFAKTGSTPQRVLRCQTIGRVLAKALRRDDPSFPLLPLDKRLIRQVAQQRRRPYIYTTEEIQRLLATARSFPSPRAPLRPLTLYTMLILAYCTGPRLGEIVGLKIGDIHLDEDESIEIRDSKFFKSRRLPVTPGVAAVIRDYLQAREQAGASSDDSAALFWHQQGSRGYSRVMTEHLLVKVIRKAGIKPARGRVGPRIHDLRHAFVVHRMMDWYRAGINPQSRLPYLATYLGHKDINSTLVYLTVTKELLHAASDRFHVFGSRCLLPPEGGSPCE